MKKFRPILIIGVILSLPFAPVVYGDTWSTNKRLTNNAGISYTPAVAVDGSNIYVVWSDNTTGNEEIYFKRSIDGGRTWKVNIRLTNDLSASFAPDIAVEGSNLYVVWTHQKGYWREIYFKRSIDGGDTWSGIIRLTDEGVAAYPAIAVDKTNIYVIWRDDPFTYIDWVGYVYFRRSADGGVSWSAIKQLTNKLSNTLPPALAVNDSNLYVVWDDDDGVSNFDLYFKNSADGGVSWSTKKRLTNNRGVSVSPAIAVDNLNIYVVWNDDTPGNDGIYFKRSVDGGVTWSTNKSLANNARPLIGYLFSPPAIAVEGSNIYVIWQGTPNSEIYFKHSGDGGVTWSAKKRLTNNAGRSHSPALAVEGSSIYVVWQDDTRGNYEIFFKKGVVD